MPWREVVAVKASEILTIIITSLIGGGGIVGLVFYFVRKYLEQALDKREAEEAKRRENKVKRASYNDALQHAQGRLLFWLYQAIIKGEHNGELEQAFNDFQTAEQKIKDHDRKIVAEQESE